VNQLNLQKPPSVSPVKKAIPDIKAMALLITITAGSTALE
jgi:hypothetical protein